MNVNGDGIVKYFNSGGGYLVILKMPTHNWRQA